MAAVDEIAHERGDNIAFAEVTVRHGCMRRGQASPFGRPFEQLAGITSRLLARGEDVLCGYCLYFQRSLPNVARRTL